MSYKFSISIVSTVLISILSEVLLILTIRILGAAITITLFTLFFTGVCYFIILIFHDEQKNKKGIINKLEKWIYQREQELTERKRVILKYGTLIGLLVLNVFSGPIITTIFSLTMRTHNREIYFLALFYNFTFFLVWTVIYNGGLKIIAIL